MIEVKNLTKVYGHHRAVDNISFTVNDGEILGFLGPNGAGKTTTMNMMTGFISATEGTVTINGYDILDDTINARKQLGYLPDVPPVYGEMRVDEYLDFVCDIKKVKKSERAAMLDDITSTVGISHVRKRIVKNLSKGYRQRVGLAQALVGYPSVLILDEPTVGLDPGQIIEMRRVIKELGKRHTILLSSHILSEVGAVCDRVMIINNGKIVASDTTHNLEEGAAENTQLVKIKGDINAASQALKAVEGVVLVQESACDEEGCLQLRINTGSEDIRADIIKALVSAGIDIVMFKPAVLSLEDAFLKVINGEYDMPEAWDADADGGEELEQVSDEDEQHTDEEESGEEQSVSSDAESEEE